jgi:hypothetical protein
MTAEIFPSSRQEVIEGLTEPLSAINPNIRFGDITQGEFVRQLRIGRVVSEPLADMSKRLIVRSWPYYWHFLVPSAEDLSGLAVVSFGVPGLEPSPDADTVALQQEEDIVQADIKKYNPLTALAAERCRPLQNDIALRIGKAERLIFAGIERRYLPESKENGWSQLIFSSWLLRASGLVDKKQGTANYIHMPREIWSPNVPAAAESRTVARTLALAALCINRKSKGNETSVAS